MLTLESGRLTSINRRSSDTGNNAQALKIEQETKMLVLWHWGPRQNQQVPRLLYWMCPLNTIFKAKKGKIANLKTYSTFSLFWRINVVILVTVLQIFSPHSSSYQRRWQFNQICSEPSSFFVATFHFRNEVSPLQPSVAALAFPPAGVPAFSVFILLKSAFVSYRVWHRREHASLLAKERWQRRKQPRRGLELSNLGIASTFYEQSK